MTLIQALRSCPNPALRRAKCLDWPAHLATAFIEENGEELIMVRAERDLGYKWCPKVSDLASDRWEAYV